MDEFTARIAPFALVFNIILYFIALASVAELAIHYWAWPAWIAYIVSSVFWFFTRGLGPIGIGLAIWGAIVSWGWPWWGAVGLFMWPLVLTLLLGVGNVSISALRSAFTSTETN